MTEELIPAMTDPLGRFWQQPNRHDIALDDKHAVMSRASFDQLPEYSTTVPSGVYPGKMWKAIAGDGSAFLRWFGTVPGRNDMCSNNQREILICD